MGSPTTPAQLSRPVAASSLPRWDWTWDVTAANAEDTHDYTDTATNDVQGVTTTLKRTAAAASLDGSTGFVLDPPTSLLYTANNTPLLVAKIDDTIGSWDPVKDTIAFQWRMSPSSIAADWEAIGACILEAEASTDADIVGLFRTRHSTYPGAGVRFNEGSTQVAGADATAYDFGEIIISPYGFARFRLGTWAGVGSAWPDPDAWTPGVERVKNGSNQNTTGLAAPSATLWSAANAHWGLGAYDSTNNGLVATFQGWRAGRLVRAE